MPERESIWGSAEVLFAEAIRNSQRHRDAQLNRYPNINPHAAISHAYLVGYADAIRRSGAATYADSLAAYNAGRVSYPIAP